MNGAEGNSNEGGHEVESTIEADQEAAPVRRRPRCIVICRTLERRYAKAFCRGFGDGCEMFVESN